MLVPHLLQYKGWLLQTLKTDLYKQERIERNTVTNSLLLAAIGLQCP